jgi:hypothetical protein
MTFVGVATRTSLYVPDNNVESGNKNVSFLSPPHTGAEANNNSTAHRMRPRFGNMDVPSSRWSTKEAEFLLPMNGE